MKKLLFGLNLLFLGSALAQTDTIFFNGDWKVCPKNVASYYRIAEQQSGGYIITDKYIETNIPQMIGFSTTIEPLNKNGRFTYYYPSGQISQEGEYVEDAKKGTWTYWSENGNGTTTEYFGDEPKVKWNPFLYDTLRPFSFALRGKTAGFFIIEDVFFITSSLGMELTYKRQSLGIDANWFRWWYEEDNSNDVGMYSQYELRTYLHADYKFTFLSFSRPQLDFYFNLYDKIGNYKMWYDKYEDYDFEGRDMSFLSSTSNGTFNEPGAGLGMRKYAKKTGFGLDVSANYGFRMSDINERIVISETETNFKDHVKEDKSLFYIRVNCFYVFGK